MRPPRSTPARARRVGSAFSLLAALHGCAESSGDDRDALIRGVLTRDDQALLRTRPALVAGRYRRMASSPYEFYRGSLGLFLRDWRDGGEALSRARFPLDAPSPMGIGDAHPENFGTLLAADGQLTLQPNDLDAVSYVPYVWDLRRLTIGLGVGLATSRGGLSAATEATIRAVASAAARGYLATIRAAARGAPRAVVRDGGDAPLLVDLFRRARRDADRRRELETLTVLRDGRRAIVRGPYDRQDPEALITDLPAFAREALPDALRRYRATLDAPPPLESLAVLDAAREFGSGVASWPRVRVLVLVRGPTDAATDDVLLEVKEQSDPPLPNTLPPDVSARDIPMRVAEARRFAWSRPAADPYWGTTTWLGLPVQVRAETEAAKTVRVSRGGDFVGDDVGMVALATRLGAVLAGVHATRAVEISARVDDEARFVDEESSLAVTWTARVLDDHRRFTRLLASYGPLLGFVRSPDDTPSAAVRALFGEGAPVP